MLSVFLTVDVEIWCDGWHNLDEKFPTYFDQYIYGRTSRGQQGLPVQLAMLRDYGLKAVFFVEPLFATRFGLEPLREVVGLILEYGQEVQLHLHPEWVDESPIPLLGEVGQRSKRQYLRQYSRIEQASLIALGRQLLQKAGVHHVKAFRAGGFGFNADTIAALTDVGIGIDSSYNATMFGPESGVAAGRLLGDTEKLGSVLELPMTYFQDGSGRNRHLQLGACSFGEMEACLEQAESQHRRALVLLSHNFELMNPDKTKGDRIVWKRMQRLCRFLDAHRDRFRAEHISTFEDEGGAQPEEPLKVPLGATAQRWMEQFARRALG